MVRDKLPEGGVLLRRRLMRGAPLHDSRRFGVGVAGVRPVGEGMVESDAQPLGAEGVGIFAHGVAPVGGVRDLEVGEMAVEHAETVVVARREDGVFHAGALREPRPFAGIVAGRVEFLRQRLVFPGLPRVVRIRPFAVCRD